MTKILHRNSEKSFLECEKKGFKKRLPALFPRQFFQKAEIALAEAALAISAFEKLTRAN